MKTALLLMIILGGLWTVGSAQTAVEKVPIELNGGILGTTDIEAIVSGEEAFLPVVKVFTFLGIKADYDSTEQQLTGFFISQDSTYRISTRDNIATLADKRVRVTASDWIIDGNQLYIRTSFLRGMFGLDLKFKLRKLSVQLSGGTNLPLWKSVLRKRSIARRLTNQFTIPTPDVYLGHKFSFIGGGNLSWFINSQFSRSDYLGTRYNFNLGTQLMGGDFTGKLFGTTAPKIKKHGTRATWRYPIFESPVVSQIILGDVTALGIRPNFVTGGEITNRPLSPRSLFTKEVYSGQFDPNADVELDASGTGASYQRADAEGNYQFEVPIIYGYGNVEVRAFDAYGQERVLRYRVTLPTTVLPPGQFEYSLSMGATRNTSKTFVATEYVNWGVSSALTMGAKLEYQNLLTSAHTHRFHPALTGVARLASNMILSGLVAPTAFSRIGFDWEFPSTTRISLSAIQYAQNSYYNPVGFRKSFEARLHQPFDMIGNGANLDVSGTQSMTDLYRLRNLQASFSVTTGVVQTTVGGNAEWHHDYGKFTTATAREFHTAEGAFLPAGVFVKGEVVYNDLLKRVELLSALVAKRFLNSFQIVGTYDRIPPAQTYALGLRLAYYFPMLKAQAGTVTSGGNRFVYTAEGSGSIDFDYRSFWVDFKNTQKTNGTGGIQLQPFYDANNNGAYDRDEQRIEGGKIYLSNISRAGRSFSVTSTSYRLTHLPGYQEYDVYLDPKSLDNPLWVPDNGSFRVLTEPNYIKRLDIPIVDGGTVRGTITKHSGDSTSVAAQMIVKIVSASGERRFRTYETISFSTGEFEFLAIPPGRYELTLDMSQLDDLGLNVSPARLEFEIVGKRDGALVDKQDFVLTNR